MVKEWTQASSLDITNKLTPEITVEAEVRAQLSAALGGVRGALETTAPFALFSVAHVITGDLRTAAIFGIGSALLFFVARLVQKSSFKFVTQGAIGIAVAVFIANRTGRAETAYLQGIVASAVWAVGLSLSMLARRPAAGFLIGSVVGNKEGWHTDPAVLKVSYRLTLVFLVPMIIRVVVQLPLYFAGEVGWLGAAKVALGYPLTIAMIGVASWTLAKGSTPLQRVPETALPDDADKAVTPPPSPKVL